MFYLEDQVFGVPSRKVEKIEDVEFEMKEMYRESLDEEEREHYDAREFDPDILTAYICVMKKIPGEEA